MCDGIVQTKCLVVLFWYEFVKTHSAKRPNFVFE